MKYTGLYRKTNEIADQIISGTYERRLSQPEETAPDMSEGFIPRPKRTAETDQTQYQDPSDDMLIQYMVAVKKMNQEIRNSLHSPGEDSGDGGSGKADYTLGRPVVGAVGRAREALGQVESGGNYNARGPVVTKGRYKGQRAVGKYQVMPGNVGPWTKEVLGREYSVEEFLKDHDAQDAVAEYKLQQAYDKHGTWEDGASVWFSGRPLASNTSSDGYNTVPQYVSKFQNAFKNIA